MEPSGRRLIESRVLRGEQDDARVRRAHGADGARQRLGLEHHACATAVRDVIHDVVLVVRPRADVVHGQLEQPRRPRASMSP